MDKRESINKLLATKKLSTNEECIEFEAALRELQNNLSVEDIDSLSEVFWDDTEDYEVMFGLIHMIEDMRGEAYLNKIAVCTPKMKEAHEWAMTLNKRIINSPEYYTMYINTIRSLDESEKNSILALLEDVKNDNPKRFADKVEYLKQQISNMIGFM